MACAISKWRFEDGSTLKTADTKLPGTFHSGSEISDLSIRTENFLTFDECGELIRSFIEMHDRLKSLFFKTLHQDLEEYEINEMNFLAAWLKAADYVMPSSIITYDFVRNHREIYVEEGYNDFLKYVKLHKFNFGPKLWPSMEFVPWRCKEFFDNMEMVQRFVTYYPGSKTAMREFCMLAGNFLCTFPWSDWDEYLSIYLEKSKAELGVHIAVNSDAHSAYYVGRYDKAVSMLSEIHFPEELIANRNLESLKKMI